MKSKILGLLAVGLLAGLGAGKVSAATIVGNCVPQTQTGIGETTVNNECQPFISDLGTLTGVTYSVTATYSGTFVFRNIGTVAYTYPAYAANFGVMVAETPFDVLLLDTQGPDINIPATPLAPGASFSVSYNQTVTGTGSINPGDIAAFIRPPNCPLCEPVVLVFMVGLIDPPPYVCNDTFDSPLCIVYDDPEFTVTTTGAFTYTYSPAVDPNPVPEPGTLALLGLGLVGLGMSRRKKAA